MSIEKTRLALRVENDFTYHPPRPDQVPIYNAIRERGLDFAQYLVDVVPDGRELSLALTALEDVVMRANSGIARHG